jgi:hypothetical protein
MVAAIGLVSTCFGAAIAWPAKAARHLRRRSALA